jgi:hypothetical protein
MKYFSIAQRDQEWQTESRMGLYFEKLQVPILPKIGIHTNMHALLFSSVVTMIVALWTDSRWNDQIYTLTHLIPCYFIGILCGLCSIISGFIAFQLSAGQVSLLSRYPMLASACRSSKLWLSASLCLMALSNLIFLGSSAWGLYVAARLFSTV